MSDRYERTASWLLQSREATDRFRLRAGITVAQMAGNAQYGAGVINELAKDSGIARATLYEYAQVARFVVRWLGMSARRTFVLYPNLTYSHLRRAIHLEFEEAIDALMTAASESMTADQFAAHIAELRGKDISPALFDQTGMGYEVISNLRQQNGWHSKRVRITVKEVKE